MATRNLTKKFVDIRNSAKANRRLNNQNSDEEYEGALLKGSGSDSSSYKGKAALPPAWVERVEEVEADIGKIQFKIRELSQLHTKRLMVNFETDEAQQERDIDSKTREITEVFHHAEKILKRFGKDLDREDIPGAEKSVRKNMQMSIAKKLQGLSMSFRSTQKMYLGRLQGQKEGNGGQAFSFLEEKTKKGSMEVDEGFTASQLQELEEMELNVDERDKEIVHIAKSIEELAAIFKELAVLVIDQGTILDRIDFNMENAVENAKGGLEHLTKAEDHQKNAMSVKCIIALVVLIIIMVSILIWKHSK